MSEKTLANPIFSLILLGAGDSTRFKSGGVRKQWIRIGDDPLFLYVLKQFMYFYDFEQVVLCVNPKEIYYISNFIDSSKVTLISGGVNRQESLINSLKNINSTHVLVSDIARCNVPKSMILNILQAYDKADIIVPFLSVSDTVVYKNNTINRDKVKLIQTPQLSSTKVLKQALKNLNNEYTDDRGAIENIGGSVFFIEGSKSANKLTFSEDIKDVLSTFKDPNKDIFIGHGFDVHKFKDNTPMYLGGVKFDTTYGFEAHSDGDVMLHALMDSLLGACGAGDIGELFPDNDKEFKNISSKILLTKVVNFIKSIGYEIVNTDMTIIAQIPKITPYKNKMREEISSLLGLDIIRVNIKATTTEKLGFIGKKEGVGVEVVSSLKYFDWRG